MEGSHVAVCVRSALNSAWAFPAQVFYAASWLAHAMGGTALYFAGWQTTYNQVQRSWHVSSNLLRCDSAQEMLLFLVCCVRWVCAVHAVPTVLCTLSPLCCEGAVQGARRVNAITRWQDKKGLGTVQGHIGWLNGMQVRGTGGFSQAKV